MATKLECMGCCHTWSLSKTAQERSLAVQGLAPTAHTLPSHAQPAEAYLTQSICVARSLHLGLRAQSKDRKPQSSPDFISHI